MRRVLLALTLVALTAGAARATVPARFTVQGVLRDNNGALQTAPVTFVVRIWQSKSSVAPADLVLSYAPPPPGNTVMASNGLFAIPVTLAPSDVATIAGALANPAVNALWLEITANGYVYARQPLTQVMSSLFADALSPACSGCVTDSMVQSLSAAKLSGGPAVTTGSAVNDGNGGFHPNGSGTVAHLTVNVPANGYLVVQANYTVEINDVNGSARACGVAVQLSDKAQPPDLSQPGVSTVAIPATFTTSDGGTVYRWSNGLHRVFAVTANPALPIYLQAAPYRTGCQVWDLDFITMTAYFVPAGSAANALSTP